MHELDKTLEACPTALEALKWNQRQLDMDGVEVGVSRQALDELIAAYDVLQSAPGVVDIAKASESIAEMVADWYGNAPLPNARITASVIAARLSRFPISSSTTSAGVTEEQTPRVTDAMVEAACAATVLGEDEFGKPVHLSPAEARCALEASRVAPASTYPGVADAIERLHEAAHRDSAVTISVRAQDLRNVLSALASSSVAPVSQKETEEPCPVCGNEDRGQGGYLSCECPSPVSQKEAEPVAWRSRGPKGGWIYRDEKPTGWPSEPVYAAPTPAVEPVGIKALQAKLDAANHVIEQLHGPLSIAALTARADTALAALETAVEALKHSKPVMDRRVHSRLADRIYRRSSPAREDRADG